MVVSGGGRGVGNGGGRCRCGGRWVGSQGGDRPGTPIGAGYVQAEQDSARGGDQEQQGGHHDPGSSRAGRVRLGSWLSLVAAIQERGWFAPAWRRSYSMSAPPGSVLGSVSQPSAPPPGDPGPPVTGGCRIRGGPGRLALIAGCVAGAGALFELIAGRVAGGGVPFSVGRLAVVCAGAGDIAFSRAAPRLASRLFPGARTGVAHAGISRRWRCRRRRG